jgi:serine/threonine-protein kinase
MNDGDLAGTELDAYILTRALGHGGMGVVYEAEDLALHRKVAIKVLPPRLLDDSRARRRFQQEIAHAVAIEHPHVVPVYAAGYDKGMFFLVLRLINGPDMASELRRVGRLDEGRALRLLGQVASALWAVHRRGIVHRDIKPHNVLIGCRGEPDEHALLTDFGIARALTATSSLTGVGAIGTAAYMAPEVCQGYPATPLSDQYSLACTAYELLSGQAPFADFGEDIQDAHVNIPPPDLRATCADVSDAVADAIHRGLAKSPTDRFPDVRALMAIDQRSRDSFDRATAVTAIVSQRPGTDNAASTLATKFGLSDDTIATFTDSTPSAVARMRRRAARAALVGDSPGSRGRREDGTRPTRAR